MGTSVVAGLDIPLGEGLKVGDGLDGYSSLGGLSGGETEAREGGSVPGPPWGRVSCRTQRVRGGQTAVIRRPDQATRPVATRLLQGPCRPCSAGGTSVPSSTGAPCSPSGSRYSHTGQPFAVIQHVKAATVPGAQQLRPGAGAAEVSLVGRGTAQWEHCGPPRESLWAPVVSLS